MLLPDNGRLNLEEKEPKAKTQITQVPQRVTLSKGVLSYLQGTHVGRATLVSGFLLALE